MIFPMLNMKEAVKKLRFLTASFSFSDFSFQRERGSSSEGNQQTINISSEGKAEASYYVNQFVLCFHSYCFVLRG